MAQPGAAAGGATACGDVAGVADVDEAGAEEAADDAEGDAAEDGADTVVEAEATGAGGAEDEVPAAHPATTAPTAANPASLSNNEIEPVITNHSF